MNEHRSFVRSSTVNQLGWYAQKWVNRRSKRAYLSHFNSITSFCAKWRYYYSDSWNRFTKYLPELHDPIAHIKITTSSNGDPTVPTELVNE